MRSTSRFMLIAAAIFLTGCATAPEKPAIYKTVVVAMPDNLLQDCPILTPPAKDVYMAATPKDREKMLIDLAAKNIKNTDTCNVDRAKSRQWKKEQLDRHKTKEKGV